MVPLPNNKFKILIIMQFEVRYVWYNIIHPQTLNKQVNYFYVIVIDDVAS